MVFRRVNLTNGMHVSGTVVVIDVLRAFTTAAYLFAAGVEDIALVSSIEEAIIIKHSHPDFLLAGEFNSYPIQDFDFGNSPSSFLNVDLHEKHFIQRTTCGTQGVVQSILASDILLASLCCVSATARYINKQRCQTINFK